MAAKGNIYQQVIAHALQAIEKSGQIPDNLRDLIEKSDLNSPEILESFPSHTAVLSALIDHGVVLLSDAIRNAAIKADPLDPRAQLRSMGQVLFIWGGQNRSLFKILASALTNPHLAQGTNLDIYRNSIRQLVIRKLTECQKLGSLEPDIDIGLLLANIHSHILGVSLMLVYDRQDAWYHSACDDVSDLAMRMMDQFSDRMIPLHSTSTAKVTVQ